MSFQWQGVEPETFAQANPFITGMMAASSLQQQMAQAQMTQAQAQSAQAAANVAPQMQQANLLQAQARPGLTQAQTGAAAAQGQEYSSQAALNQQLVQNPALRMTGPAGIVAQLDMLKQMNAQPGSQTPYTNPQSMPTLPGGLNAQSAGAMGLPTNAQGLTISPQQISQMGGANQPSNPGASNQDIFSPLRQYQQAQAYGTSVEKQAALNADTWNNMQNETADASGQAVNQTNTMKKFVSNYAASTEKGANFGDLPSSGTSGGALLARGVKGAETAFSGNPTIGMTHEQLADAASKQLIAPTARQMFTNGHLTNMDVGIAQATKPTRALDNDAVQSLAQQMYAQNERTSELQQYIGGAKAMGVSDPHVVQQGWNYYQNMRPAIGADGSINNKYLGTFKDFLTPQVITQIQKGETPTPTPVKEDLQAQGVMPNQAGGSSAPAAGRVRVISPTGTTGTISSANLQAALAAGYRSAG